MRIDLNGIFGLPLDAETAPAIPAIEVGEFEQAMLTASLLMPNQTQKLNTRGEANFNLQPNAEQETPDLFEENPESEESIFSEDESLSSLAAAVIPVFIPVAAPIEIPKFDAYRMTVTQGDPGDAMKGVGAPKLQLSDDATRFASAPEIRYEASAEGPVFSLPVVSAPLQTEEAPDFAEKRIEFPKESAPLQPNFTPESTVTTKQSADPVARQAMDAPAAVAQPEVHSKANSVALDPGLVKDLNAVVVSPQPQTAPEVLKAQSIPNLAVYAVQAPKLSPGTVSPLPAPKSDVSGTVLGAELTAKVSAPLGVKPAVTEVPKNGLAESYPAPMVQPAPPVSLAALDSSFSPLEVGSPFDDAPIAKKGIPSAFVLESKSETVNDSAVESEDVAGAAPTERTNQSAIEIHNQPARTQAASRLESNSGEVEARRGVEQIIARVDRLQELRPPGNIVIRMSPEDLGTVTLSIRTGSVQPEARMSATNEQMFHALQSHKHELSAVVEGKGVTLSGFDFNNQGGREHSEPAHKTLSDVQRDHNFAHALTDSPVQSSPRWATDILDLQS